MRLSLGRVSGGRVAVFADGEGFSDGELLLPQAIRHIDRVEINISLIMRGGMVRCLI